MKLSDFLEPLKLIYVGDELVLQNPFIDYSTVEFYELTADNLTKIHKNVINKTKAEDDYAKFLFDIWEYVCSIEKDITYAKFKKLAESPTSDFMVIYKSIVKIINKLFNLAKEQGEITKEAGILQQKYPDFFPKEETLEERILRLTKELDNEKDFTKKKPIFEELNLLYKKLEEKKNG
jgi:hypothetical protein